MCERVCVCVCVCMRVLYRQGNAYFGIQKTITKSQQFTYYGLPELNTCSRTYSTDTIVNPSPTHTPSHSPLHSSSALRGSGTRNKRIPSTLRLGSAGNKRKKKRLEDHVHNNRITPNKRTMCLSDKKKGFSHLPKKKLSKSFSTSAQQRKKNPEQL